jgi:hypothetical protein
LGVAVVAGLIAVILRIVPHPTNFSSVGACSLFGGARLRTWHGYLVPLIVMVVSDLALWVLSRFNPMYSLWDISRVYVYASFMIYVLIGHWLRDKNSVLSTSLAASLGGLQFFFVTNFCTWLFQPLIEVEAMYRYSRDLPGLMACFAAALPFYQTDVTPVQHPFVMLTDRRLNIFWTILGDILFTTIYLLVYARLAQRAMQPAPAPAPAVHI